MYRMINYLLDRVVRNVYEFIKETIHQALKRLTQTSGGKEAGEGGKLIKHDRLHWVRGRTNKRAKGSRGKEQEQESFYEQIFKT